MALSLATACQSKAKPDVAPKAAAKEEPKEGRDALPGLDHGLVQSPVNILSGQAEGGHHEIAEYQLKQFHFHTPSEHQIDGITYPMEGHIVNMIEPKTPEDPPRYLVVRAARN
jgi:hypothetical protein